MKKLDNEQAALKALALKHNPEGYRRMKGIQSLRKAIIEHQANPRNRTTLPSGRLNAQGKFVVDKGE